MKTPKKNLKASSRPLSIRRILTIFGSIFNLAGSYYSINSFYSREATDAGAIAKDWEQVGKDIRGAIEGYSTNHY